MLTRERYFFREDELLNNLEQVGFKDITDFHTISYTFSSKRRLEQELGSDIEKLNELNKYIRSVFPEELKEMMNFHDLEDDIQFSVAKKIFTAVAEKNL